MYKVIYNTVTLLYLLQISKGVTMTLCLYARSLLRIKCQMSILTNVWRHGRGVLWAGGGPCMTGCLECPLARPVLAQS